MLEHQQARERCTPQQDPALLRQARQTRGSGEAEREIVGSGSDFSGGEGVGLLAVDEQGSAATQGTSKY